MSNSEHMHPLCDCIHLSDVLWFKFFHEQVCFAILGRYYLVAGRRKVEPLNSAAIELVHMAACMMQVWADDGDDEWHCVQTLTEANNW